jgi:hypothetical protein
MLTARAAATKTVYDSVCPGQYFYIGSNSYYYPDVYSDTLRGYAHNGCDSIVTLHLLAHDTLTPVATVNISGDTCTVEPGDATYQWVHCSNEATISGATLQWYAPEQNGTYECLVTQHSCSAYSNCLTINNVATGTGNLNGYHLRLYPNPTTGLITLQGNDGSNLRLEITDVLGARIKTLDVTGENAQFDIAGLPAGIYQVTIRKAGMLIQTFKVVKE